MSRWEWATACAIPALGAYLISDPFARGIAEPGGYFYKLKKPCYMPPFSAYGPVWGALYVSMGHASYLVWETAGGFKDEAKLPLMLYGGHLIYNWFYIPLNVTFKKQGLNFFLISGLTAAAGVCGASFYKINKKAGYLFIPYVAWCLFNSILQFDVWRLNRNSIDKKE